MKTIPSYKCVSIKIEGAIKEETVLRLTDEKYNGFTFKYKDLQAVDEDNWDGTLSFEIEEFSRPKIENFNQQELNELLGNLLLDLITRGIK